MAGKLDDYLQFNQTVLNVRAQRQQLLASNIANADTPNYKARDIDFASTLKNSMSAQHSTVAQPDVAMVTMRITASAHLTGKAASIASSHAADKGAAQYRKVDQASIDGNTVDMDVERNQFTDNALHYEASVSAINAQLKSLLSVIQPGGG